MKRLRAIAFAWWAAIITLVFFCLSMLALPLNPRSARISHRCASLWGRVLLWGGGLRVRIEGPGSFDLSVTRMIVANHASYLDPPTMVAAHPGQVRFMLKQELMRLPFIGWYTKSAGHFLVNRDNPREGKRLLDVAVERAKRYQLNPIVFPEGTRTNDGKLAAFRNGAFQLAISAGIEIQPVAILGTYERMPRGSIGPNRGGDIIVRVGEPISVEGLKGNPGRKVLAAKVEEALRALGVE
jgi:1-acyl-sn-glycerol-3-phosphate acyltransferase